MNNSSLREEPDLQTFRTVFHYCFVIIVVPVASFFVAKSIVFDEIVCTTKYIWEILRQRPHPFLLAPVVMTSGIPILSALEGVLGLSHVQSSVYSAVVTVVVLHIILGAYIHRAFATDTSQKPTKQD